MKIYCVSYTVKDGEAIMHSSRRFDNIHDTQNFIRVLRKESRVVKINLMTSEDLLSDDLDDESNELRRFEVAGHFDADVSIVIDAHSAKEAMYIAQQNSEVCAFIDCSAETDMYDMAVRVRDLVFTDSKEC